METSAIPGIPADLLPYIFDRVEDDALLRAVVPHVSKAFRSACQQARSRMDSLSTEAFPSILSPVTISSADLMARFISRRHGDLVEWARKHNCPVSSECIYQAAIVGDWSAISFLAPVLHPTFSQLCDILLDKNHPELILKLTEIRPNWSNKEEHIAHAHAMLGNLTEFSQRRPSAGPDPIRRACLAGRWNILEHLLQKGSNPNQDFIIAREAAAANQLAIIESHPTLRDYTNLIAYHASIYEKNWALADKILASVGFPLALTRDARFQLIYHAPEDVFARHWQPVAPAEMSDFINVTVGRQLVYLGPLSGLRWFFAQNRTLGILNTEETRHSLLQAAFTAGKLAQTEFLLSDATLPQPFKIPEYWIENINGYNEKVLRVLEFLHSCPHVTGVSLDKVLLSPNVIYNLLIKCTHKSTIMWFLQTYKGTIASRQLGGRLLVALARSGNINLLRFVFKYFEENQIPLQLDQKVALVAAQEGHLEIVKWALDRGFDLKVVQGVKLTNLSHQPIKTNLPKYTYHRDVVHWLNERLAAANRPLLSMK